MAAEVILKAFKSNNIPDVYVSNYYTLTTIPFNFEIISPYSGINLPIKDSLFNDYILTLVLTTNIFINHIREDDIFLILKLILLNNFKNEQITKLKKVLLNSPTKLNEKIKIIKEFMKEPSRRDLLVKKYIINYILDKIEYLDEFINTSFIEILNPVLYKNCIGFTGTAESILMPEINDKQIFSSSRCLQMITSIMHYIWLCSK
jgi:hypothetical protein